MAILKVKDKDGNIITIPAIKGDKGEKGDKGDKGDSASIDVQVNGTSIVENGVANIPIANRSESGLVKVDTSSNRPLYINNGLLTIGMANNTEIDNRSTTSNIGIQKLINGANVDYAVKQALADGKGSQWTNEEQSMARDRLGLGDYELIGTCTVTEDDVKQIRFNIDTNGQAFSLKKIKLVFNKDNARAIVGSNSTIVSLTLNNKNAFYNTGLAYNNNGRYYFEVYPDKELGVMASYKATTTSPTHDGILIGALENQLITDVVLQIHVDGNFVNGLYVELWGVRG